MTEYLMGHVKRDPSSGAVAIRTAQPDQVPAGSFAQVQSWLVSSAFSGVSFLPTAAVDGWDDIYVQLPEDPPAE